MPNPKNVYWVILAGGSGSSLWPLSRDDKPKQFLTVTDSNLIQQSVNRLKSYPSFPKTHVYISTGTKLEGQVRKLEKKGLEIEGIITEPGRRDTGPAILLSVLTILKKNPDAYIMFLPADPYIPTKDNQLFASNLTKAMNYLEKNDQIVLLGKKPDYPATGFGYIEYQKSAGSVKQISRFHEKPQLSVAKEYLEQGNMLWNMGMFVGKGATFKKLFKVYAPEMSQGVKQYLDKKGTYDAVKKLSIDFAVMEPASEKGQLAVVPVEGLEWHDVGNVDVFMKIRDKFLRAMGKFPTNNIMVDATNNLFYMANKEKLLALVDVKGLCIVDTKDVLLIASCKNAEKVKRLVIKMTKEPGKYGPYL